MPLTITTKLHRKHKPPQVQNMTKQEYIERHKQALLRRLRLRKAQADMQRELKELET